MNAHERLTGIESVHFSPYSENLKMLSLKYERKLRVIKTLNNESEYTYGVVSAISAILEFVDEFDLTKKNEIQRIWEKI